MDQEVQVSLEELATGMSEVAFDGLCINLIGFLYALFAVLLKVFVKRMTQSFEHNILSSLIILGFQQILFKLDHVDHCQQFLQIGLS